MKYPLFIVFALQSVSSFSQQYTSSMSDTVLLRPLTFEKTVLLKLDNATIGVAYPGFLEMLQRIKKAQLRAYRKKYKHAIKELQSLQRRSDSVVLSDDLIKKIDIGIVYRYFARNINEGNAIIFNEKNFSQQKLIRKKISQQSGMLQGGQASEYFLIGEKEFFFKVNDQLF